MSFTGNIKCSNPLKRRYLLISAVWIVTFLLFSGCAYFNTLFNAKKSFNEGLKKMKENTGSSNATAGGAAQDFETTIEKCWKLIEIYSDQNKYADDALLYIIKSEFYLGRYTQGRVYLEQFFAKYPESKLTAEAQLWYGKMLLAENDIEKANEYFLRVTTNSDDAELRSSASFELGRYAYENENYDQAIKMLETALDEKIEDKSRAQLFFYLGESYFSQKNYDKAIEQYKKVDDSSPEREIDFRAKLNLAKTFILKKDFKNARKELDKLLSDPRHNRHTEMIRAVIADSYKAEGNLDQAVELYSETVRDGKKTAGSAYAAFNLARVYEFRLNNLDSALTYYGAVEKIFSKFDSVEVAKAKIRNLGEYRIIRDDIRVDERLADRLTNDPEFKDSLYTAQLEDSLRKAQGLPDPSVVQAQEDSTRLAQAALQDSLNNIAAQGTANDSLSVTADSTNDAAQDPNATLAGVDNQAPPRGLTGSENPENQANPLAGNPSQNQTPGTTTAIPLEQRKLPKIEFDLMNNRYHLAEFYLLKVEEFDSAIVHYQKFIQTYDDSILTPKAMYSLAYIFETEEYRDSLRVKELEDGLIAEYSASPFAQEILKKRGVITEQARINEKEKLAEQRFLEAEELLFAGNYRSALAAYREVAQMDTTMEISAKAQYASGWVLEKNLNQPEEAKAAYETLISRYADHKEYVNAARIRISPPAERPVFDPNSVSADSLAGDTAGSLSGDQGEDVQPGEIALEDILQEKIRWRQRRAGGSLK